MMLTASVPHWFVRGMLWNCLFPVQFPECWDVGRHAEMDVMSEGVYGKVHEEEGQESLQSCRIFGMLVFTINYFIIQM
jgi:hypothetical protein